MTQPFGTGSSNEYWAASASEKIGDMIQGKIDAYYAYLTSSSLVDLWRKSFYAYYGMFPETALTGFGLFAIGDLVAGGAEGELVRMKINHYRNLLTHQLNTATAQRPATECRAVNSDSKSVAQAYLGDGIVDYFFREKKIENNITDAVETALVFGEGFGRLDWDATAGKVYGVGANGAPVYDGDIIHRIYNPFDVVRDTTRASAKNHIWYIFHDTVNKYDLAAKYPHLSQQILASSSDTTTARRFIDPTKIIPAAGIGSRDSELVDQYELIHDVTPAMPQGRYTVTLQGGLVLFDGPLPFETMANVVARMSAQEIIGAPFGWTIGFDCLGIQQAIDKLYSVVMSNQMAGGVQNFWQPPGNELTKTQIAGGLNLLESVVKPEVLTLCQTPAEIFNFIAKLESVLETLTGVSAVNRGETPENLKSGSALAFVAAQAITFSSGLQSSLNSFIEATGTGIINMLKTFAATPRLAIISGSFNRPLMKTYMGKDLEKINRVVVDVTSATSKTIAGKIQIAQDLLQSGLIRNAREYLTVVNTGELESLYESEMSEIMLVKSENEDLRSGLNVMGLITDDHRLHFLEHRAILANPDSRKDPELVRRVLAHNQWHIDNYLNLQQTNPALLALMGEQPLPSPQPQQPPQQPQQGPQPGPGGPVGGVLNAAPPAMQKAATVKLPNMPKLPAGADQASQASYDQLKGAANG